MAFESDFQVSKKYGLPQVMVDELPSLMKAYPAGSSISYRTYSTGEVESRVQSKMSTREVYESILEGVETKGFDKHDLTLSDTLFIALLRKLSTFGTSRVEITKMCVHDDCDELNVFEIESSKIDFDDIDVPSLPINVTFENKEVFKFKPLTVGKYLDLFDAHEIHDSLRVAASCCVGGDESTYKKLYSSLPVDGAKVQMAIDRLYHGIKPIKHKCKKCGKDIYVELDSSSVYLRPSYRDTKPLEDSISFD